MTARNTRSRPRTRRKGRGVLLLVALFFAASAIVRAGIGIGPAIAREVSNLAARTATQSEPVQCEIEPDLAELLADLGTREDRIARRELDLAAYEHALEISADQIRENMAALEAAEAELSALISVSEVAAENDLAKLTAVYENMKPADAATLFAQMDAEFAAGFFSRMRPDAAAAVMTGLPAETAYAISVVLAGRNATAPKN